MLASTRICAELTRGLGSHVGIQNLAHGGDRVHLHAAENFTRRVDGESLERAQIAPRLEHLNARGFDHLRRRFKIPRGKALAASTGQFAQASGVAAQGRAIDLGHRQR